MRIVFNFGHPSRDLDTDGSGQAVRARALRDALRAGGHDVVTVARDHVGSVDPVVSSRRRRVAPVRRPDRLPSAVRDTGRLLYGRLHAARVADAARRHRADAIIETHVAFSTAGAHAATRAGVPLVVDDLAPPQEERTFGVGLPRVADAVWRHVTRRARVLVAVNEPIRRLLAVEVDDPAKLAIVGNGYDAAWVAPSDRPHPPRTTLGIDPAATVITFVGSFLAWHRTDMLVAALAAADLAGPWHALLIGDGPERAATQRAVAYLGMTDRVRFTGQLAPAAVAAHLAATDVAVLPASSGHGNPMKLVEYLATGTTVVAPDQPTVTELCRHGVSAFLFPPGDMRALAVALRTVAGDRALARRLASGARAAAADLTWERQAGRLVAAMRAAGIGGHVNHDGAPPHAVVAP